MKNVKCVIGATILTPICLGAFGVFLFGILWLINTYNIVAMIGIIITAAGILGLGVIIWAGIYEYCVEHHRK